MTFDLNTLISLLFLAGGGGAFASVVSVFRTMKSGKIQNEETLIRRLDTDNKNQQSLRKEAEDRADNAEKESEEYRKQRNKAQEELAWLRWHYIQKTGENPPTYGQRND